MTRTLLIAVLLAALGPGDGPTKGREGNAHFRDGRYDGAAAAYREGLQGLDEAAPIRFGLLHNLGAALLRGGDPSAALDAFDGAAAAARTPEEVARAAYNAGNAAFAQEELRTALDRFRRALLADPGNEDAKFNYEFVKRRLEEQQQQQQQQQQQGNQQSGGSSQSSPPSQEGPDGQQQNPGERTDDAGGQQPSREDESQNQPSPGDERQEDAREEGRPQSGAAPRPDQLSREQAERILQALGQDEKELLRELRRPQAPSRPVEKDW